MKELFIVAFANGVCVSCWSV